MLSLFLYDLPVLAAALLIGIAVGRWIVRRPVLPAEKKDQSPS